MGQQANDPRYNFDAHPTLDEIIEQQGKGPIDIATLRRNAWPDDEEPIEDFLEALREWRGHDKTDPAA